MRQQCPKPVYKRAQYITVKPGMDSAISAGVCTTLRLYTVLHLNSHDARSLSAECESSIPGKCALVTGIMYSLTLSISLGECLVNFSGAFAKLRKVTY